MIFNVTLNFRGGTSLTRKTNLVLLFDKQTMEGMYTVYNPVAWRYVYSPSAMKFWRKLVSRVTAFPKGGKQTTPVFIRVPVNKHQHHWAGGGSFKATYTSE